MFVLVTFWPRVHSAGVIFNTNTNEFSGGKTIQTIKKRGKKKYVNLDRCGGIFKNETHRLRCLALTRS